MLPRSSALLPGSAASTAGKYTVFERIGTFLTVVTAATWKTRAR